MTDRAAPGHEADQSDVIAFLSDPANWPGRPDRVDRIDTHGAIVFLAGDEVLKLKRAVRLLYLNFSTLAARRRCAAREIALNQPHATEIYLGLVSITRDPKGNLHLDGPGVPVDVAVRMRRFPEAGILSHVAQAGGLTRRIAVALGDTVAEYHAKAPVVRLADDGLDAIANQIVTALSKADDPRIVAAADALETLLARQLERTAALRAERAAGGYVRRCHGDLHLNNIVLWHGEPVAFDAIEFDERLATVDTLYDLAFLVMDLERSDARAAANIVLARYLWRIGDDAGVAGLAALPLYLGLRAGVRAMVALDRSRVGATNVGLEQQIAHIEETLSLANRCLAPPPPRLLAIGGLSGTGKTVLAEALAPRFGAIPGAWHIRSDLERKHLAGVGELERLPASSYTAQSAREVYDRLCRRARMALAAGHSVIIDAVFAREDERGTLATIAAANNAEFHGLWLEAPAATLRQRVETRTGDASDATPEVVALQQRLATGHISWPRLDASGAHDAVVAAAAGILRL